MSGHQQMPSNPSLRFETLAISAGRPAPVPDGPLNVPITPASGFRR